MKNNCFMKESVDSKKVFGIEIDEGDYTLFVKEAEEFAKILKKTSNSQLRKFYDEINTVEAKNNPKKILPFFKVKLAYACGRGVLNKPVYNNLTKLADYVLNSENINRDMNLFVSFFEALIAYHKFHGGSK